MNENPFSSNNKPNPFLTPPTHTGESPKPAPRPADTGFNAQPTVSTPQSFVPAAASPSQVATPTLHSASTSYAPKGGGRFSLFKASAYLPEYFVMLIMLVALIAAIASLVSVGLEHLAPKETGESPSDPFGYSDGISSFTLVSSLSTAIVALPAFLFFYFRTRAFEQQTPAVRAHRWRKGFLGLFIVIEALSIVGALVSLVFNLLSRSIDVGGFLSLLSTSEQNLPVWVPITSTLFTVLLTSYALYILTRYYRASREES